MNKSRRHELLYRLAAVSLIVVMVMSGALSIRVYAEEPTEVASEAESSTKPSTEPSTESGTEPSTESGTESSTEQGTEPSTELPTITESDTRDWLTVAQKLDLLLERLGTGDETVYFTVNQKACSTRRKNGHGCSNCNICNIIESEWFKKLFGNVDYRVFPAHNGTANTASNNGASCFGFACFVQWYLFSDDYSEPLEGKCVAVTHFTKSEMMSKAKPGDILRVNNSHSMIVYSVEEDGVVVVDSNWNVGGQLNCVVQKHLILYDSSYKGDITYVCRVTKAADMEDGQAGEFGVGEWYPEKDTGEEEKHETSKDNDADVEDIPSIEDSVITDKDEVVDEEKDESKSTDETAITWVQDRDGNWYCIDDKTGINVTGWLQSSESGLWYYLDMIEWYMLHDCWLCDPESGLWYYLDQNGAMCTSWIIVDDIWYYLDLNGAMCTGWNIIDGKWYLFAIDGAMLTGWQEVEGKCYYMTENGECLMNTTTPDGYVVDENGARIENAVADAE